MLADWFEDKFNFDFEANAIWANFLDDFEEPDQEIVRIFSHIINVHHLWIRRIVNSPVESAAWDIFDSRYLSRLNQQNFQETQDFLANYSEDKLVSYTTTEGEQREELASSLLYHILNHSAHHRGQLALLAQQKKLDNRPESNFVGWRR